MIKITGPLTRLDTTPQYTLKSKTESWDGSGHWNEYIYLNGVASTVAYDWVSYTGTGSTTRLTSAAIGPVAIAQAACVAGRYGWYFINGSGTAKISNVTLADNVLYTGSPAASVTNTATGSTTILGAFSTGTNTGTTTAQVYVNYPFCNASSLV